MRARTSIITGAMAVVVLAVVCMSAVTAIAPAQVAYSESMFGSTGARVLTYKLEFHNRYTSSENGEYRATVVVDATVTYEIVSINSTALNVTETISGLTINYPYANHSAHEPFLAVYDQTVAKEDFLLDFANEIHGGPAMGTNFLVANHSVANYTLVRGSNATSGIILFPLVNKVIYHKNNTVEPLAGFLSIRNRFIVSSNITGTITDPVNVKNAEGNSSTDKIYAHAIFYTPMSFANQAGTFWLGTTNAGVADLGLWTISLPGAPDTSTFPMGFTESDTYTWHEGQGDEAFRWRAKYEVGYPKVGGTEQAKFDSATGVLLEYYTEQTRVDATIGTTFYQNMHPHYLKNYLVSVSGLTFAANASPEVPGFPVITLLVAIGIGFALVYRKFRK